MCLCSPSPKALKPSYPPCPPQYEGPESVQDVFCLNFSYEEAAWGTRCLVPLVPGGQDLDVTEENRHE